MQNLGITRNKNQLASLIQSASERNINIIPLPLTEIVSLLNDGNQIPDLTNISWLIFSSANGVDTFFKHCNLDLLPKDMKIAVVGDKTADAVRRYNLDIHFQPTEAYGKNLFEEFIQKYNEQKLQILYIRAEKIITDSKHLFINSQIKYNELISYKSQEKSICKSEIDKLSDTDYILFTAPTSVESYKNQFGNPKAKLIAIGNTTKEAIEQNNWKIEIVLDKPEIEKVLECI